MGHKYTKEEILAGALALALEDGLATLSFGRVAKRFGTSDRVVVYYFPTKADLIANVVLSMGLELQSTLASVFDGSAALGGSAAGHAELVRAAWPILASAEADPVFALFFEANGLAATGQEPYATIVKQLVAGWLAWLAESIDGPRVYRQAQAEAAIVLIDGLLLLRQLAGPESAERAARTLGVAE